MTEPLPFPGKPKAVWSPKALAVFGLVFTAIPAGVMFSINYGRYGLRKQQAVWFGITTLLFVGFLLDVFLNPDRPSLRWSLVNLLVLWIIYLKQASLFREWILAGGKRASVWSGLLISVAVLVVSSLGVALALFSVEDEYAYELLMSGDSEQVEKVLRQSRIDYPWDLSR